MKQKKLIRKLANIVEEIVAEPNDYRLHVSFEFIEVEKDVFHRFYTVSYERNNLPAVALMRRCKAKKTLKTFAKRLEKVTYLLNNDEKPTT